MEYDLDIAKKVIYVKPFKKFMISLMLIVEWYPSHVNDGLRVGWIQLYEIILRNVIELSS